MLVAPVELDVGGGVLLLGEGVRKAGDLHIAAVGGPGLAAEQREGVATDQENDGGQHQQRDHREGEKKRPLAHAYLSDFRWRRVESIAG